MNAGSSIGRYVVKRKLAEGGMAEIFLCAARGPEGFEKEVVIKRIRSHFASDAAFVRMFVNEARLASRLQHPNIVQIFDFDQHEDSYYIAMEYVRGRSLWELRKRCREQMVPLPPVLCAFIAAEVARALDHAHGMTENGKLLGLVHRDVTPHNVLLSFDGAVKLADFGIVKSNLALTAPGTLKGKLAYMSPEQARGEPVDARTDVFALGIVLWELLTGGRLFEGGNEMAVLRAVQESAIVPPARLNPDVPGPLSDVVCRALERARAARFGSASELERALREVLLLEARAVDDTDVGAFLRGRFPGEGATPSAPSSPAPPPSVDRNAETAAGRGPGAGARTPELPRAREAERALPEPPGEAELPTLVVRAPTGERPGEVSEAGPLPKTLGLRHALAVGAAAVAVGAGVAGLAWWRAEKGTSAAPTAPANDTVGTARALSGQVAPLPAVPSPVAAGPVHEEPTAVPPTAPRQVLELEPPPPAPRALAPVEGRDAGSASRPPAPAPSLPAAVTAPAPARRPAVPAVPAVPVSPSVGGSMGEVASAAAPAAPGTLQLQVLPWANAWLDGKPLGEVGPLQSFPVAAGPHVLKLEHPRGVRELRLEVKPGEVLSRSLDMLAP